MTALAWLQGARLRRVDAPGSDLWALTLVLGELRGALLVSLAPGDAGGVGWVTRRPHGQPATSFVRKLRKELEGGRIADFVVTDASLELEIRRADQQYRLVFDWRAANVHVYLGAGLLASQHATRDPSLPSDAPTRAAAASEPPSPSDAARSARADPHEARHPERDAAERSGSPPSRGRPARATAAREGAPNLSFPADHAALEAAGTRLLERRGDALFAAQRGALRKSIAAARKRLARRQQAVAQDAERAAQAPELRERAQHVLANLHAIPRGARTVRVVNYAIDPPAEIEIALDPARTPHEQAEAWFKQARRFERGRQLAAERGAETAAALRELDALAAAIDRCTGPAELAEVAERADTLGIRTELPVDLTARDKAPKVARHVAYRTFRGSGGRTILVGKGAADNDVLTREVARPQDLWLHARDRAGAHVVVPLERGQTCPPELLVEAAMLAAHFSDARGEPLADVSYTPRRYVRKPKGAPTGAVVLEREKVLRVQLEPARLAALLKSERE